MVKESKRDDLNTQKLNEKKIYRVSEGAQLSGVCAGLEASGKGSATMWRLIFFMGAWFYLVGLIVYIYLSCAWPKAKSMKAHKGWLE